MGYAPEGKLVVVVAVPAPFATLALFGATFARALLGIGTLLGTRRAAATLFLVDRRRGDGIARTAETAAGTAAEAARTRTARTTRRPARTAAGTTKATRARARRRP